MKRTLKKILCSVLCVMVCVMCFPISYAYTASTSQIPDDAIEFNGNYYKAFDTSLSWIEAKKFCENLGGYLVTITSQEEQNFIADVFLSESTNKEFYLIGGFRENSNSKWQWITDEPFENINWGGLSEDENQHEENQHYNTTQNYIWITTIKYNWTNEPFVWLSHDNYNNTDHVYNTSKAGFICEWDNIYNLGEETYSFENYGDGDSKGGHCFGMSMTSSGYYLGVLDLANVGVSSREIYKLNDDENVRKPICYYQGIQGSIRNQCMVAGGTKYKDETKIDIETDWNEVVNYVKNHNYDDRGVLQIGYLISNGGGGHAVNFLRYDDESECIYVYDNRFPETEQPIWQTSDGKVFTVDGYIDSITLRYVPDYFTLTSSKDVVDKIIRLSIYSMGGNISIIGGAIRYIMETNSDDAEYYVYELSEGATKIKIVPLIDNATFTYLGQEYTFGKIDEDTYAELVLSTNEENAAEFEIFNEPGDEFNTPDEPENPKVPNKPANDCSHLCHKSGFMGFIWKLLNFFQKLFKTNPTCACGAAHY